MCLWQAKVATIKNSNVHFPDKKLWNIFKEFDQKVSVKYRIEAAAEEEQFFQLPLFKKIFQPWNKKQRRRAKKPFFIGCLFRYDDAIAFEQHDKQISNSSETLKWKVKVSKINGQWEPSCFNCKVAPRLSLTKYFRERFLQVSLTNFFAMATSK